MKNERVGETNYNKYGTQMKIIIYNKSDDLWVEFQDSYKAKVHTAYKCFLKGEVRNPYDKTVLGVGLLGVGNYNSKSHKKIYKKWTHMLERCYNPYKINEFPTYKDCYVCDEWLNFQNFAKWYEENYYEVKGEVMCLDKDILIKGNKIYSPETCIFVPERINTLFTRSDKSRGKYPIGITFNKNNTVNPLEVSLSNKGKHTRIDCFPINRPFQAFTCYKNFKEKLIKEIADEYKNLIPSKLYDAMYRYEVEIND